MSSSLLVVMAQISLPVGNIAGNCEKIIATAQQAYQQHNADVVVFPELSLTGYPPEDLLLRPSLQIRIDDALQQLLAEPLPCAIVIGLPMRVNGKLMNQALFIADGKIVSTHNKRHLPNYQVFDEKRYFHAGNQLNSFEYKGVKLSLDICEDVWFEDSFSDSDVQLHLVLNASPFHIDRLPQRLKKMQTMAKAHQQAIIYVNLLGGQDELVFDGGSFAIDAQGDVAVLAEQFKEQLIVVQYDAKSQTISGECAGHMPTLDTLWQAMVMGLRDYVNRNGFKGVVLGLSGGIDSAVSLAVAVDALGAERVHAVMMPFKYTSPDSIADAEAEAKILNVRYDVVDIESIYNASIDKLNPLFAGLPLDTTEQNMQARIRGLLLMSISNKLGHMVLTTGNKSEMAVGYATLYGDMCGGYNVLKDLVKMQVFALAKHRNLSGEVIPARVISRPPSAELAPDQKDEDSLPPYDILDDIIEKYVEQDLSAEMIVAAGHDRDTVFRICRLIDINEYKRRQAPEGVRLTARGFGKDRRYPITSGWSLGK